MSLRFSLMVGLVLGVALTGAAVVVAASSPFARGGAEAVDVSGSAKKLCLFAFETRADEVQLDGGGASAGTVQAKKSCPGPVSGSLSVELTVLSDGLVWLGVGGMRATCVGTGGLNDPCTVGQQLLAGPGEALLTVGFNNGTRGMEAVWPNLKRGIWLFEVYLFGTPEFETMAARTFIVQGYQ